MEATDGRRADLRDKAIVALEVAAILLITTLLAVAGTAVVRVTIADVHDVKHQDDHLRAIVSTASAPQPRGHTVMPVGPGGGSGGAGTVEEGKGFYAGRPLFKVPPSSPCSAKAERC